MGIYYGDKIYGVKIVNETSVLYSKEYDREISVEEKEEARKAYNDLLQKGENGIFIYVYIDVTTTFNYPPSTSREWCNAGIDDLSDSETV